MIVFPPHFSISNKGVKVELGIPQELWDKPSVEITNMKTQVCVDVLKQLFLGRHAPDLYD